MINFLVYFWLRIILNATKPILAIFMIKINTISLAILTLLTFNANACSKHIAGDAQKELIKSVPHIKSEICAKEALSQLALDLPYTPSNTCHNMNEQELSIAKKIANEEKNKSAFKELNNKN